MNGVVTTVTELTERRTAPPTSSTCARLDEVAVDVAERDRAGQAGDQAALVTRADLALAGVDPRRPARGHRRAAASNVSPTSRCATRPWPRCWTRTITSWPT